MIVASTTLYFDSRKSLQEEARCGRVAALFLVGYLPQRYNRPI